MSAVEFIAVSGVQQIGRALWGDMLWIAPLAVISLALLVIADVQAHRARGRRRMVSYDEDAQNALFAAHCDLCKRGNGKCICIADCGADGCRPYAQTEVPRA